MGIEKYISNDLKIQIYNLYMYEQCKRNYLISKNLGVSESTARRWGNNGTVEILKTGNLSSKRKWNSQKRLTKTLDEKDMSQ